MPSCWVSLLGHRWETLKPYPRLCARDAKSSLEMVRLCRCRAERWAARTGSVLSTPQALLFHLVGTEVLCFLCMDFFFSPEAWLLLLEACVRRWGWVPVSQSPVERPKPLCLEQNPQSWSAGPPRSKAQVSERMRLRDKWGHIPSKVLFFPSLHVSGVWLSWLWMHMSYNCLRRPNTPVPGSVPKALVWRAVQPLALTVEASRVILTCGQGYGSLSGLTKLLPLWPLLSFACVPFPRPDSCGLGASAVFGGHLQGRSETAFDWAVEWVGGRWGRLLWNKQGEVCVTVDYFSF